MDPFSCYLSIWILKDVSVVNLLLPVLLLDRWQQVGGGSASSGVGSGLTSLTQDSGYPESDVRGGITTPTTPTPTKENSSSANSSKDTGKPYQRSLNGGEEVKVHGWNDPASGPSQSAADTSQLLSDQTAQLSTTSSQVSSGLGSMVSSGTGSSSCGAGGGGDGNSRRSCVSAQPTPTSMDTTSGKTTFWENRNDTDSSCLFQLSTSTSADERTGFNQSRETGTVVSSFDAVPTAGNNATYSTNNWNGNPSEVGYDGQHPPRGYSSLNWAGGQSGSYFTSSSGYTEQGTSQRNCPPPSSGNGQADWSRTSFSIQPCGYAAYSYGGQTQSINYPLYPLEAQPPSAGYRGGGGYTGWGDVSVPTPSFNASTSYADLFSEAMNSRLMAQQQQPQSTPNLEELQSPPSASTSSMTTGSFGAFGDGGMSTSYDPLNSNLVVCSMPPLLQTGGASTGLYPTAFN